MSNLGLRRCLASHEIEFIEVPVGDRNVLDELERQHLALGGEQSGHVDLHATTPPPATARSPGAFLLDVVHGTGHSLSLLAGVMQTLPAGPAQRRRARPRRRSTQRRAAAAGDRATIEGELAPTAGCSCAPSGTEPVVRVMVEAPSVERAELVADRLVAEVERRVRRLRRPRRALGDRTRPATSRLVRACAGSSASFAAARDPEPPELAPLVTRLDDCAGGPRALGRRCRRARRRSRRRSRPSTPRCAACPACAPCSADPVGALGVEHRAERVARAARERRGRRSTPGRCGVTRAELEAVNAALLRAKDAAWAVAARPAAHRPRGRRPRRHRTRRSAAIEAFTSVQVALSALDRLEVRGRDSAGCTCSSATTASTSPTRAVGAAARAPARRTRCSATGRCARPTGSSRSSTRPRPRSASSATTRGACARRSATTSCCTSRSRPTPPRSSCSATRAGRASASSPRPTRTRSTTRSIDVADGPYVVGRAQRRRRQLRRPHGARGPGAPGRDHHRREGDPRRSSRRTRRRRDRRSRRSARRSPSLEGSVAIGAQQRRRARRAAARAARERPGAVRRAGRGRVRRRERAVRRSSRRRPRYLRLDGETPADPDRPAATRGQIVVLARHRRRHVEGIERLRLRRHAAAVSRRRAPARRRSRRATSTAATYPHFLLKEISEAPESFRKTLRGQGRRATTAGSASALGDETLHAVDSAQRLRDGTIRRVVVIGQGTAAVAGQSLAAALDASRRRRASTSKPSPATELSGFGLARRHAATRSSSRSARAGRPPTPTAPSTSRATAARRCSRSSTAATATSSTSPTACSTRPTAATSR